MLQLDDICASYGSSQVLFGVSIQISKSSVVSLLGRNGMGKSTLIKTICGMLPAQSGSARFNGVDLARMRSFEVARLGVGLVPEGRRVFTGLTVRENLISVARTGDWDYGSYWDLDKVFDLFPRLRTRCNHRAENLSGGEQQMLAIARALMTNPRLLLLDEATEGLAPLIREEIWNTVLRLKNLGMSVLIIDKHIKRLQLVADFHYALERGRVFWSGDSSELAANEEKLQSALAA